MILSGVVFVLILASCKQVCEGIPTKSKAIFNQGQFPGFMENLYRRYLAGRAPFSSIVRSNAAVVKRSNIAFELTFNDLGFLLSEKLKSAKLLLDMPEKRHCSLPKLNITVLDDHSGQLLGHYAMVPQRMGVNTLTLTKSVHKLASNLKANKKLKVRITLRNTSPCSNLISDFSNKTYLITKTDEKVKTKKRRSIPKFTEDAPNVFRSGSNRRSKRSAPTCVMKSVYVDLRPSNKSVFILPTGFNTSVCGFQQPVPLGSDPMLQQLAASIARALKSISRPSNPRCCMPSRFQKLAVLYYDTMYPNQNVLRYVNNVVVTECACVTNT